MNSYCANWNYFFHKEISMPHNKILVILFCLCAVTFAASCSDDAGSVENRRPIITRPTATPLPTPHPAAQNAIKSLRRIATATEVGVNFRDYGTRIIDLKTDVDEDLAQLPESQLKQEITFALDAYVDANTAWNASLQNDCMLTIFEPATRLHKKYKFRGEETEVGGLLVRKDVALHTIWEVARKHLEKATEMQNQ